MHATGIRVVDALLPIGRGQVINGFMFKEA